MAAASHPLATAAPAGESVVTLTGDLHSADSGRLREVLGRAMGAPSTVVVVDASGVTSIDAASLREILAAEVRLTASGRGLQVRAPSSAVRALLRWHGLDDDLIAVPSAL